MVYSDSFKLMHYTVVLNVENTDRHYDTSIRKNETSFHSILFSLYI